MDCYIVRVYRHITHKDGKADEIAGLVERVGKQDSGKPFSTYKGLVNAMQEESREAPRDDVRRETGVVDNIRAVNTARSS